VSTAFLFVAGTGLCTLALGAGLVRPLSSWLLGPGVSPAYLSLSFLSFIFSYLGTVPRAYLRALEASGKFTALESGSLLVMLVLNIVFIAGLHLGPIGILWSGVIVNGAVAVGLSIWVVRATGLSYHGGGLRRMATFGLPLILSNVSLFVLNFSDRFFLERLRSLETVGIYAVGYKLAFMLNYLLVQPFYAMWQPRMYVIYGRAEHAKIFRQIFALYSLVLTFSGLGLAVFGPEIVSVMADRKFQAAQEVVPVVALSYVLYGIGLYAQLGMFLTDRTRDVGAVGAVAAILNLGLNYLLIGPFGMMGAAWATLAGFGAIAAGSYWYGQRALPLGLGIGRATLSIGVAICLYLLSRNAIPKTFAAAVEVKMLYLLSFPVLAWRLGVLSPGEIGTLLSAGNKAAAGINRRLGWSWGR
jgi:O-antigen/teichoic acid export membrane protein